MKTLISCAYNMENCCVELKFNDGSMIAIDTIAVENEVYMRKQRILHLLSIFLVLFIGDYCVCGFYRLFLS